MLGSRVDGCARLLGPCGEYRGIRDELAAIASQQRASSAAAQGFQVVITILGAPSWAARPASGCELADASSVSRPLRMEAIARYRGLISSLIALGVAEGVALPWWSPWNEPNDPRFISPQRGDCAPQAPTTSAAVYAELARAMASELLAAGGGRHMLVGELNDLRRDSPHTTSVASFVAALPMDVLCLAGAFSIHAYAARHGGASVNAVGNLESVLATRGGCAAQTPIWVTEAGAGAPHPGRRRPTGEADELAGCDALAKQIIAWDADPRVGAVFQYTFREDPAFPVGLVSANLAHVYPTYGLWLAYVHRREHGEAPPAPIAGCA